MSSSFFPARSLELVRMAPFGDGMKWIMRAPKTEASAAALPPLASCSVVVSIMVVQNCNLVVLKSGEWLLTECSMFGCWLCYASNVVTWDDCAVILRHGQVKFNRCCNFGNHCHLFVLHP